MNEKDEEKEMTINEEELTETEKEESLSEALDINKWTKKDWYEFFGSFIPVFVLGFVAISIIVYANDGYYNCWNGDNVSSVRNTALGNYSCFVCDYGTINTTKAYNICNPSINNHIKTIQVNQDILRRQIMYPIGQILTFGLLDNIKLNLTS